MANNPIKWSALGTVVNFFSGTELAALGAAGIATSTTTVTNTSGDQYGEFVLRWNPTSTPSAGGYISAWLLQAMDGTNYETALGATLVPQRPADLIFPIGNEGASAHAVQRVTIRTVLPPCLFKVVLQNNTSVASDSNTGESLLDMYAVNDNLVTP